MHRGRDLDHQFRLHFARTLHAVILEECFQKACKLQRRICLQSKEVAYDFSFRDAAEFSRMSRCLVGCVPRESRLPLVEKADDRR